MDLKVEIPDTKPVTERRSTNNNGSLNALPGIIRYPLNILLTLISSVFRLVKPFAPQLIPLAVFILTIPILLALSFSAGWFVWRSIAVGWETEVFLQYGDGVPPYAVVPLPDIAAAQQPYDICLHLVVPASETNFELGNFMTTLTLLTSNNKTLATIRRPALVTPRNTPLSFLYHTPGTVDMRIQLLNAFQIGASNVIAQIELGRKDQWKTIGNGEGRELSVLSALLRGVVVHKGLRGVITRFPLLTATISSGIFLFISFIVLASCLLPAIEWRFHGEAASLDADATSEKPRRQPRHRTSDSGGLDDGKSQRKPKGTRRSRSATTPRTRPEFKTEETVASMSSSASFSPLRRRRSRLSQHSESET